MKSLFKKSLFLVAMIFIIGCNDEPVSKIGPNDLLIGKWNVYESGYENATEQTGISPGISTLTVVYEHGFSFSTDGTFGSRYYDPFTGVWSEGTTLGNYEIKNDTILLTYFPFPGSSDEYKLDLPLIKLDKDHLWFRVALFGAVFEHHLERVN